MPERVVFDLKEVERAAGAHKRTADVMAALNTNSATLSKNLRTDAEFLAAYNRGRERGGFKLYELKEGAGNGNGAKPLKLDPVSQEIYATLEGQTGYSIQELVEISGKSNLDVSNAIRSLSRQELSRSDGNLYFKVALPDGRASDTDTPPANDRPRASQNLRLQIPDLRSRTATAAARLS